MTDLSGLEETVEAAARIIEDMESRYPEQVIARAVLAAALAVDPPQIVRAEDMARRSRVDHATANAEVARLQAALSYAGGSETTSRVPAQDHDSGIEAGATAPSSASRTGRYDVGVGHGDSSARVSARSSEAGGSVDPGVYREGER